jgi:hypothetical protein
MQAGNTTVSSVAAVWAELSFLSANQAAHIKCLCCSLLVTMADGSREEFLRQLRGNDFDAASL